MRNNILNNKSTPLQEINKSLPLRILTEKQFAFWKHNGYVIIPKVIDQSTINKTEKFLWEYQEMDPNDESTWTQAQRHHYGMTELNNLGMVECYNNQILWDNRQNPSIYNAFVDIWDQEKLWVTIDRANLNPPNKENRAHKGFIHWDVDTSLPSLPVNVQGILALSDTNENIGGFQCVPKLYRELESWRKEQPIDRDPYKPDLKGFDVEFISMKAGDLLIFNSLLPHGIRPNISNKVRLAQYIAMMPAKENDIATRYIRIKSWKKRIAPDGLAFSKDPRNWEQTKYPRAELNSLGKKLLGIQRWD
ncbi:phytanoyl-CoA dioxygenase [Paraphotobacterium marinum]|uniref:Phytanoyl-CoA dioxygenase n=1 Tax=Paraphotobacterium marinum TaxID=1755811 RepID=A0A220VEP0_9GAMM|nr:phytanoyl-CoA dioxygenase family protein [Paraphotobacterium marinum]ASK78761.1 phytanoyl-CoA dioxygenase [Paraphotobacterium marinum]